MNRKILKREAKKNLWRYYFKTILVIFIIGVIVNGGYRYTFVVSNAPNSLSNSSNSNFQIIYNLINKLSKFSIGSNTKGVIGPLFNSITESNSIVIGSLNAVNLFLFNRKINVIFISLFGIVIFILLKIFIQDVFKVGYKRYFLEQRRYQTNIKKILFPFKVRKNINIGIIILIKNIYNFLWSITIVGGIVKHYEYFMIPYVLAENPALKKKEAFKLSKQLMYNEKWNFFKLDLSFIFWNILNIITFGLLDIFFLRGYKECVYAEAYIKIRRKKYKELNNCKLLNDSYLDIEDYTEFEYPMDYSIPITPVKEKKRRDYTPHYTLKNYILMFFTFSFIGWLWEVLFHIVSEGRFVNRGTMYGPWLPIYGIGGILILILLKKVRKKPMLFFICAIILAGIIEYSTAWYLETFNNAKWWDYTGYFLNIKGRVCLEGLLVFGFGGAAVTYFVAPSLNELFNKINPKISQILCYILLIVYFCDFAYATINPNTGVGITEYDNQALNERI